MHKNKGLRLTFSGHPLRRTIWRLRSPFGLKGPLRVWRTRCWLNRNVRAVSAVLEDERWGDVVTCHISGQRDTIANRCTLSRPYKHSSVGATVSSSVYGLNLTYENWETDGRCDSVHDWTSLYALCSPIFDVNVRMVEPLLGPITPRRACRA